jgi:hypothetical protein
VKAKKRKGERGCTGEVMMQGDSIGVRPHGASLSEVHQSYQWQASLEQPVDLAHERRAMRPHDAAQLRRS